MKRFRWLRTLWTKLHDTTDDGYQELRELDREHPGWDKAARSQVSARLAELGLNDTQTRAWFGR